MANNVPNDTLFVSPQFKGLAYPFFTDIDSAFLAANAGQEVAIFAGVYPPVFLRDGVNVRWMTGATIQYVSALGEYGISVIGACDVRMNGYPTFSDQLSS